MATNKSMMPGDTLVAEESISTTSSMKSFDEVPDGSVTNNLLMMDFDETSDDNTTNNASVPDEDFNNTITTNQTPTNQSCTSNRRACNCFTYPSSIIDHECKHSQSKQKLISLIL